jgi:hypothetical protein
VSVPSLCVTHYCCLECTCNSNLLSQLCFLCLLLPLCDRAGCFCCPTSRQHSSGHAELGEGEEGASSCSQAVGVFVAVMQECSCEV